MSDEQRGDTGAESEGKLKVYRYNSQYNNVQQK